MELFEDRGDSVEEHVHQEEKKRGASPRMGDGEAKKTPKRAPRRGAF